MSIEDLYGKDTVSTKQADLTEFNPTDDKLAVLRKVLLQSRWNESGGFPSYSEDRGWGFVSAGLGQATPEQWDSLLDLAGIIPDQIKPLGNCIDCKYNSDGSSQGYGTPCSSCKQPFHSYFVKK